MVKVDNQLYFCSLCDKYIKKTEVICKHTAAIFIPQADGTIVCLLSKRIYTALHNYGIDTNNIEKYVGFDGTWYIGKNIHIHLDRLVSNIFKSNSRIIPINITYNGQLTQAKLLRLSLITKFVGANEKG